MTDETAFRASPTYYSSPAVPLTKHLLSPSPILLFAILVITTTADYQNNLQYLPPPWPRLSRPSNAVPPRRTHPVRPTMAKPPHPTLSDPPWLSHLASEEPPAMTPAVQEEHPPSPLGGAAVAKAAEMKGDSLPAPQLRPPEPPHPRGSRRRGPGPRLVASRKIFKKASFYI
jgi:hypothetical protein